MIVMLLTTQNEADVLRLNIEHHLSWGIDHVVVCDNRSTDHTQDVVAAFGDRVSTTVFEDFHERQRIRTEALERVKQAHPGAVEWVGVSDTDEFFWAPDVTMKEVLAEVPGDILGATFHQKLFLPTEVDPAEGPVYARQLYRTGNYKTPLHRSYREGKTFYRASWLERVTNEHRANELPHAEWSPDDWMVHHYMVRDEDQFLMKVRRLTSWRQRRGIKSKRWYHKAREALGMSPEKPFVAGFKEEWWDVLENEGEDGLRRYYRTKYRIQEADLAGHLESGDLVYDDAFANYRAGVA